MATGIDRLEVAGVRHQMDVKRLAVRGLVIPRGAQVIFDVPSAQHTPRIDILEASEDIHRRLSRHQNHDAQPPAMAHPHDNLFSAQLPRPVQGLVQQAEAKR